MSNEQVGMYIRLLCFQHQKGKLSEKDMLAICPSRDEEVWQKFEFEDGFYINKKMYNEAERRKNFCESRKNNKKKKNICSTYENHMSPHMETETVTVTKTELEGGMGGDFNWESVKGYFLNADEWMFKFCSSKVVSRETLVLRMNEFLNDIELRNEYKPLKDLQSHFTNWFNKSEKLKKNAKPNKNSGRDELLESLRQKHAGNHLG